VTPPLSQES
jgi:hypothetical protein